MTEIEIVARVALGYAKRSWRVLHAVIGVTKRHVPKWVAGLLTVCLFIPGPLDELLVLLVIAVLVAFKPVMRADLKTGVKHAWEVLDIERPRG